MLFFFFFQAEDGIRFHCVTGVQTCALPISGELHSQRVAGAELEPAPGRTAEALHSVPLLAERVRAAGVDAPVLRGLANVIEGKVATERWTASLTAPRPAAKKREKVLAA